MCSDPVECIEMILIIIFTKKGKELINGKTIIYLNEGTIHKDKQKQNKNRISGILK